MIINLIGEQDSAAADPLLVFQLPKLYFDRRFAYKVGMHVIHVEMSDSANEHDLMCLNTNLVDRSSVNPSQTIGYFWTYSNRGSRQHARPTPVVYYSLHLFDFEHAKFEVIRQFTSEKAPVEKIFVQLEVVRVDPYGRLQ